MKRWLVLLFAMVFSACGSSQESHVNVERAQKIDDASLSFKGASAYLEGNGMCFPSKNASFFDEVKDHRVALFVGDTQLSGYSSADLDFFVGRLKKTINALVLLKKRPCLYLASSASIHEVAEIPNLEGMIWLGHGANGDVSIPGFGLASPDQFPIFSTSKLRFLAFFSCEAGKKRKQWLKLFPNSPDFMVYLDKDSIPMAGAFEYMDQEFYKYLANVIFPDANFLAENQVQELKQLVMRESANFEKQRIIPYP